jgi:aldehyde dehydrogenase (NAD+)
MTSTFGPLADEKQFQRVLNYIDIGKKTGAPIIGGAQKGDKGFFIDPTIFVNIDKESPIYKEEIFGPVLNIVEFETEDEVVALANDTVTGLSGK